MKKILILLILFSSINLASAQDKVPYGNNPEAGHYFDAGAVKLYYEIYGEGPPLLMLHGGVYGYIDEFEYLIPLLAKNHQVICLATRGHGKSEIGHEPFTYEQRAKDARKLLKHLKITDKAKVLGFSDGGFAALQLAASFPDDVLLVVAMGVGHHSKPEKSSYSAEGLLTDSKDYFEGRLKLMPEPDRWDESLQMLNGLYNDHQIELATYEKIQCPVILMNGDHDDYYKVKDLMKVYDRIPNVLLSVIPACNHVILYCNFPAVWESLKRFFE